VQAALHGQGIALGRMTLTEQYIREGRLIALFGPPMTPGRGYHALLAPRARDKPEARAFVEWLRAEIRHDAAQR